MQVVHISFIMHRIIKSIFFSLLHLTVLQYKVGITTKGTSKNYVTLILVIFDPLTPYITKRNISVTPLCYVTNHGVTPSHPRSNLSLAIILHMRKNILTHMHSYRGTHWRATKSQGKEKTTL